MQLYTQHSLFRVPDEDLYWWCCKWTRFMWLNISKGASCRKTQFWVLNKHAKSKYLKCGPVTLILRFCIILESSKLALLVAWRIWCNNSSFTLTLYANTLPRFQNFKRLFLKINFSLICYVIINEITILRMLCQISQLFIPRLGWKNSH